MKHRLAATAAALTAIVLVPLGATTATAVEPVDRTAAAVDAAGTFSPLPGARILDTRTAVGVPAAGPVGEDGRVRLQVAGRGGVPAASVSAVVLNLTGVGANRSTWITAWPSGTSMPYASQLNIGPSEARANLVTVPLGADGAVMLRNAGGSLHLVADVVGFYSAAGGVVGGGYHAVATPHRSFDSRGRVEPWAAGESRMVPVGAPGMDASVTAVSVNLTALSTVAGWLTAWSGDGPVPGTSTLNYRSYWATPNHAVVPVTVDAQGQPWIEVYASHGRTNVIVDVVGWYDAEIGADGLRFEATTPTRVLDTRRDCDRFCGEIGPGGSVLADTSDVAPDAVAVVANVLGVQSSWWTWLGVSPTGTKPGTSTLNLVPGENRSNATVATTAGGEGFHVYNAEGQLYVVVDVAGYFR